MKKIVCSICLIISFFFLSAQTQLNNLNTTWSQVLGGKFLSKPVLTPYGFIGATDGRTITAVTSSGNLIWEEKFSVNTDTIINTVSNDFTLCVTNERKRITLFNPSGVSLWNKVLDYEIIDKAYEGRDGRFFLRGDTKLACFSINGICKWEINTEPQSKISLQELEDGSLVLFLKNLNEGKSRALRVTPFGKILEDITFAGEVLSACTTSNGVLLTFSDGAAGLFGLENGKAVNRFVMDPAGYEKNPSNFFTGNLRRKEAVFISGKKKNAKLMFIDTKSGSVIWEKECSGLNIKNIMEAKLSDEGFFICDDKTAYFLNLEGTLLWSAKMPEQNNRNKWKYAVFTENNTLVVCHENWTMEAWIVEQHTGTTRKNITYDYYLDYLNIDSSVYDTIYFFSLDPKITSQERYKKLEAGFYGDREIDFTSDILSACQAYMEQNSKSSFGAREELSAFKANPSELESLLSQLPLYGTRYTTNLTAKLLKQEKNRSIINCIVKGIQKDGYDPDGEILQALELLSMKTSINDPTLQMNICDAVYSICRFMGRPAYNKNGKSILKNLLGPANNSKVRLKARETLELVAALEK